MEVAVIHQEAALPPLDNMTGSKTEKESNEAKVEVLADAEGPIAPPPTPTKQQKAAEAEAGGAEAGGSSPGAGNNPSPKKRSPKKRGDRSGNEFPNFKTYLQHSLAPTKTPTDGSTGGASASTSMKNLEMSPEITLIEFISTTASFFGVKRQNIDKLEYEIRNVSQNNVMPANAAAWYMAKLRYYIGKSRPHLLDFILKNYPKKFVIRNTNVEFLETYEVEVALKKLQFILDQGLFAYFSHKVDDYGVFFFDPRYYENTEPFHTNLRETLRCSANVPSSKLVSMYFDMVKSHFHFQQHDSTMVSISKRKMDICTNTTGIIVSMIDNSYGIIRFPNGAGGTEKALFCVKSLFMDSFPYLDDPMILPPVLFDGYKISNHPLLADKEYSWLAVLVWCGSKPNPKFCSTLDMLLSSDQFHQDKHQPNKPLTFYDLVGKDQVASGDLANVAKEASINGKTVDDSMKVGVVMEIRKNGAVVSMNKAKDQRAFIPGWSNKNIKFSGQFLTTTQGVSLSLGDLVGFYLDPKQKVASYVVGCNVLVLKHAEVVAENSKEASSADKSKKKKSKSKREVQSSSEQTQTSTGTESVGSDGEATVSHKRQHRRRSKSSRSCSGTSSSGAGGNAMRKHWQDFLLNAEIVDLEDYDSDVDPSYVPRPIYDPDLDFDEYSNDEVSQDEFDALQEDAKQNFDKQKFIADFISAFTPPPSSSSTEELAKKENNQEEAGATEPTAVMTSTEVTKKCPMWLDFLLNKELDGSDDESPDFVPDYEAGAEVAPHHMAASGDQQEETKPEAGEAAAAPAPAPASAPATATAGDNTPSSDETQTDGNGMSGDSKSLEEQQKQQREDDEVSQEEVELLLKEASEPLPADVLQPENSKVADEGVTQVAPTATEPSAAEPSAAEPSATEPSAAEP